MLCAVANLAAFMSDTPDYGFAVSSVKDLELNKLAVCVEEGAYANDFHQWYPKVGCMSYFILFSVFELVFFSGRLCLFFGNASHPKVERVLIPPGQNADDKVSLEKLRAGDCAAIVLAHPLAEKLTHTNCDVQIVGQSLGT